MRRLVTAISFLLAFPLFANAQEPPAMRDPPTVGLPIFTLDGSQIGVVVATVTPQGERALIAEIGRKLGFGTEVVAIPFHLVREKGDRLVLAVHEHQLRHFVLPVHNR